VTITINIHINNNVYARQLDGEVGGCSDKSVARTVHSIAPTTRRRLLI